MAHALPPAPPLSSIYHPTLRFVFIINNKLHATLEKREESVVFTPLGIMAFLALVGGLEVV